MTSTPTIPPWAARCWIEGKHIHVDLPMGEELPSHRLTFPNDGYGLSRLVHLLQNRNAHSLLGTQGDRTQHNVDKDIALLKRKIDPDKVQVVKPKDKFTQAQRAGARSILRMLGLTGAVQR